MNNRLSELLYEFESFLRQSAPVVPSFHPHYEQALWEMVQNGGKRFRPRLLFATILALDSQRFAQKEGIFQAALALECLHTYSLIHDDLPCMDNADLRRAHPTLHVKYSEDLAVLVGDALNTYAFYLLSKAALSRSVRLELIATLASNGGLEGMVLGQVLDCYFENIRLDIKQLEFLHLHKTGMLIAAALKMGATICEADEKTCEQIYALGLQLGLMFQIYDDIIDITKASEEAGKPTHSDIQKNSYTNLLGLETSRDVLRSLHAKILDECHENATLHSLFGEILHSYFKGKV